MERFVCYTQERRSGEALLPHMSMLRLRLAVTAAPIWSFRLIAACLRRLFSRAAVVPPELSIAR
ncbi:hypothetical protein GOL22_29260 [Sinorhizobium medicae]|nr:hypothetical protein [Sinorhizobium medicae]